MSPVHLPNYLKTVISSDSSRTICPSWLGVLQVKEYKDLWESRTAQTSWRSLLDELWYVSRFSCLWTSNPKTNELMKELLWSPHKLLREHWNHHRTPGTHSRTSESSSKTLKPIFGVLEILERPLEQFQELLWLHWILPLDPWDSPCEPSRPNVCQLCFLKKETRSKRNQWVRTCLNQTRG